MPGYNFYYELPATGKAGGVGMYVKNSLGQAITTTYKLTKPGTYQVEDLWLEIFHSKKKYIIGGIYRHPNQNISEFSRIMESTLSQLSSRKYPCIIVGDFNIDLVQYDSQRMVQEYLDVVTTNNFMPLLILPTRITARSSTLIDHIYYYYGKSSENQIMKSGCLISDISDHLPNYIMLFRNKSVFPKDRPMIRIFSEKARDQFCAKLNCSDFNSICECKDANAAFSLLSSKITTAFNESFPQVRLSRKRARDKKWITASLKKASRTKTKLYKKWMKFRTEEAEFKYKNYRKVFRKLSRECELKYYQEMFDRKQNSIKQIWKNLNSVCSYKFENKKKNIFKIHCDGKGIMDPEVICNKFNDYFASIGVSLREKNNCSVGHSENNNYKKYCLDPVANSMFCNPVTEQELLAIIMNLKNKKAPGPDNIGPELLKSVAPVILNPLLCIYNLSFSTGVVPDALKVARIVPVYKKGDDGQLQNYRPISLLSSFHKILEKLMAIRLTKFINANSILFKHQFGFRRYYSTILALIDVTDYIYEHLDKDDYVLGIYLDLQKAFDTVDHTILLQKMYHYGIRGVVHSWFTSYLSNRTQFTTVNGHSSTRVRVTCGVPQGSVLGPLLFLLYVNDIANSVPRASIKLFADDTNMFITGKTMGELEIKAKTELENINLWLAANKLYLNCDKTCYMIFSPKIQRNELDINLTVNEIRLKRVSSCKYLGVIIDDKLKWIPHIETVTLKLKRFVGILWKLRYKLPHWYLRNIYYAFIHSSIVYGIEIYGNTCTSYLDKITKLNNKLLRILQHKEPTCKNDWLYYEYSTLPPLQLFNYQILTLVYKQSYTPYELPFIFWDYFLTTKSVHNYNTRHNIFQLSQVNSNFGSRSLKFKGPQLWNRLPVDITNSKSLNSFRKNLKQYFYCEL